MAGAVVPAIAAGLGAKAYGDYQQKQKEPDRLLGRDIAANALLGGVGKQLPARPGAFNPGMTIGPDGKPSFNPTQSPGLPARPVMSPQMQSSLGRSALGPEAYNAMQSQRVAQRLFPTGPTKDNYIDTDNGTLDITTGQIVPNTSAPREEKRSAFAQTLIDAGLKPGTPGYNAAMAQQIKKENYIAQPAESLATKSVFDKEAGTNRMATPAEIAANPARFTDPAPQKPYGWDEQQAEKAKDREVKEGTAKMAYENADAGFQSIIDMATQIKDDPKLADITGTWDGLTPNLTQEAVDLQSKIDTLVSETTMQTLKAAREGSASGATGFGALNKEELNLVQNGIANLKNMRQGTPAYKDQLNKVVTRMASLQKALRSAKGAKESPGGWTISKVE